MNAFWTYLGAAVVALGVATPAAAAQPLLTAAELVALQGRPTVRVIDIRAPRDYAAGHIAGAVSAPYGEWRGPAHDPGALPALDRLVGLVQRLGVATDTHAVVVSRGADGVDSAGAARVYWTLKYLGLEQLSVLNGGITAWQAAGLPLTQAPSSVTPSTFTARLDPSIMATTQQVLEGQAEARLRLVDARPPAFYQGRAQAPTVAVAGTIAGAVDVPFTQWFEPGTGKFMTAAAARARAGPAATPAAETVTFCNTGHLAAADWFVLSEVLGQKNVRLYPPSLAEWSRDPARPMQNVPGRGRQILNKLKALFG